MVPLLIRRAVPPPMLENLRDRVAAYFDQAEPEQLAFISDNGLSGPHMGDALPDLFAAIKPYAFRSLGADAVIPLNHVLFRRRRREDDLRLRKDAQHNFHQDHDLIPTRFFLNMWLPLTHIDGSTTGLSFVLPPTSTVSPFPFDLEAYLRDGGYVWTPEMQVGDLLIFNHLTIHGTLYVPHERVRYSIEFRLGRAADLADYSEPVIRI